MSASPNTYYFLGEFVEMDIRVPELPKFSKQIVEFHRTSQREFHRMTGFKTPMFGFHTTTCQGCLCLPTTWNDSWADFFCQLVRNAMAFHIVRNGHWKNLEELVDRLCTHVVPLVLGPLEAEGRSVKPTLIHGDLWEGNIGIRHSDGTLVLFDAGSYWAHNEIELATMNSQWSPILNDPVYRESYREQMGISEPVEQFEDRVCLYSCYMTLEASASNPGTSHREE